MRVFRRLSSITLMSLLIFYSQTQAQVTLVEEVTKQGDELVIPYQKYKLDNGLTLIIHEDHSDPIVHVDVTYHVGSAREELYKSGFAHFFEHMMFQGSENVADEEHFKIVSESGGTMNGTTNRDRTNYFETVPSNQLELMLWLEADRMGFLLNAVTQEKFEVQRSTVKNEKQQNYDNRPYGRWREINAEALYPFGHPYSWLTIGILEDLDRVDVTDLKKFFLRWYGPNNATLTVGGDVNPEEVIEMVTKYFGPISAGPEVEKMYLDPVTLEQDRYVSYVDPNIRFPALLVTFPTVPEYHEDQAAIDCLAAILGRGKQSYFYKKFVESQKAIQASTFQLTSELSGELIMFVLPFPGITLGDFETQMREALVEFETNGVSDEDIQKFIAEYESNTINSLASVSGKVSQLAFYETFADNPNQLQEDIKRYTSITKEDVMRVYEKYVKDKFAVVQSVLPKGMEEMAARPNDFTAAKEGDNPFPTTDYDGLTYNRAEDSFDRSQRPVPSQAPLVSIPQYWNTELNGIQVIGAKNDELPTVTLFMTINGGARLDALNPEKAGLASLTGSMMNESTENFTSDEISEELRKLGSTISFNGGGRNTTIFVQTLKKNLAPTLALLEEKLMRPKFEEKDFNRLKNQALEAAKAAYEAPASIASNVFDQLLYGQSDIRSLPTSGSDESIPNITLEDVKNFYAANYAPNISQLVIVGDVSQNEVLSQLSFLENWETKAVDIPTVNGEQAEGKTIYLVDKPNAPQSEIRIGYLTDMSYDAVGDYFKSYLMNYPLGGAFNSRINLNLREDKGYTYGAFSYFNAGKDPGPFAAQAGVRADVTDSSVVEFMNEIEGYVQSGISPEELDFMKKSIGQKEAREYETPQQKAGFLNRILTYDLSPSYKEMQKQIINSITQDEINRLIQNNINLDKMMILVVGDKASVEGGLKAFAEEKGYNFVELDVKGNPVEN